MSGPASRIDLPLIVDEDWRRKSECLDYLPDLVWDDRVDGESERERAERHERAKLICNHKCTVRAECSAKADWKTDEGIRGGHKLPSIGYQMSAYEAEMLRLLRKGWPLDQAASAALRVGRAV